MVAKPIAAVLALLVPTVAVARDLAITDVTVVDTRTGERLPHRTVIVRDGRISAVDRRHVPKGIRLVRGTGRFLVPGLWDMVTHLSWTRASALPLLAAEGITAVRDQGGDLAETATWAAGVREGRIDGPTIFQVGPMLNGRSFNRYQFALGTPDQARGAVRLLAHEGVDGLEIERRVPRDIYAALMTEAGQARLPVGGKIPLDLDPAEASTAGQRTIDNLETLYDGRFRAAHEQDVPAAIDRFLARGGGAEALFATFRRNGTAITPCLYAVADAVAHNDPAAAHDTRYRYVARSRRTPAKPVPPEELAEFRAMLPRLDATVRRLDEAGVTLLAGTDIAGDRVPGFSLHDELDLLAAAGLSPLAALQAATLHPAEVMRRTDDYGTVAPGRIADLLLLDGDPIEATAALHRIAAVVLHGRLLTRPALDALLRRAEALAAAS